MIFSFTCVVFLSWKKIERKLQPRSCEFKILLFAQRMFFSISGILEPSAWARSRGVSLPPMREPGTKAHQCWSLLPVHLHLPLGFSKRSQTRSPWQLVTASRRTGPGLLRAYFPRCWTTCRAAGKEPGSTWAERPAGLPSHAAPHSVGYGSSVSVSCGVGARRDSDPALLWLWCRPVATALIWPLARKLTCALGGALKSHNNSNNTKERKKERRKEGRKEGRLSQDLSPRIMFSFASQSADSEHHPLPLLPSRGCARAGQKKNRGYRPCHQCLQTHVCGNTWTDFFFFFFSFLQRTHGIWSFPG